METKKLSWFRHFPPFAGTLVGIALTAIGGVMVLNVVLKLYVFGFDTPTYGISFQHECVYDNFADLGLENPKESRKKLSEEERANCITERKTEEKERYLRDKKENFVDGLAMLLVGIPFWVIFARKRKEEL